MKLSHLILMLSIALGSNSVAQAQLVSEDEPARLERAAAAADAGIVSDRIARSARSSTSDTVSLDAFQNTVGEATVLLGMIEQASLSGSSATATRKMFERVLSLTERARRVAEEGDIEVSPLDMEEFAALISALDSNYELPPLEPQPLEVLD